MCIIYDFYVFIRLFLLRFTHLCPPIMQQLHGIGPRIAWHHDLRCHTHWEGVGGDKDVG